MALGRKPEFSPAMAVHLVWLVCERAGGRHRLPGRAAAFE